MLNCIIHSAPPSPCVMHIGRLEVGFAFDHGPTCIFASLHCILYGVYRPLTAVAPLNVPIWFMYSSAPITPRSTYSVFNGATSDARYWPMCPSIIQLLFYEEPICAMCGRNLREFLGIAFYHNEKVDLTLRLLVGIQPMENWVTAFILAVSPD